MKKYEYLELKEYFRTDLGDVLNTYGRQGWELVIIVREYQSQLIKLFLKREIL